MLNRRIARVLIALLLCSLLIGMVPVSIAADDGTTHKVKWGESLSQIAWMYGVTVREIMDANDLDNANYIYQGQKLMIPGVAPVDLEHVVKAGESLLSIAADYGVSVWDIARRNGLWNINLVIVGDTLLIPAVGEKVPDEEAPPSGPPQVQELIIISSPAADAEVSSPLTIAGWGSAFENTLAVDVLDEMGAVLGQGYVMIQADLGVTGPFTGTVEFTPPAVSQMGRVSVYRISARDGAIEHLASVTVKLMP